MKKKITVGFILIMGVLATLFLTTCEIGLGRSVDTKPPTVSIGYPPVNSIIRSSFIMSGTATDETSIQAVRVTVRNTDTGKLHGPYSASYDGSSNKWRAEINRLVNPDTKTYEIPDGRYELTATSEDSSGKTSSINTVYILDNTAPVLVLTRPNTYGPISANNPYEFGAEIRVTGNAIDVNNIDTLVCKVKEYNQTSPHTLSADYIVSSPMPNIGSDIDVILGTFKNGGGTTGFYNSVYGGGTPEGKKKYYFILEVTDEAREYKGAGTVSSTGNKSFGYYLRSGDLGIYNAVLTNYAIDELKKIFNHTYHDSAKVAQVFADLQGKLIDPAKLEEANDTNRKVGSFLLDPANTPLFKFVGENPTPDTANYDEAKNQKPRSSTIIIEAAPGFDKIPIKKETLAVALREWDPINKNWRIPLSEGASTDDWKTDAHTLILLDDEVSTPAAERLARASKISERGDVSYITLDLSDPRLSVDTVYRLMVFGKDEGKGGNEGTSFIVNGTDKYLFKLVSNGNYPVLTLKELNDKAAKSGDLLVVKAGDTIKIEADIDAGESKPQKIEVFRTVAYYDGATIKYKNSTLYTINQAFIPDAGNWEYTVPADSFKTSPLTSDDAATLGLSPATVIESYEIRAKATNENGSRDFFFTVNYDTEKPKINDISVSPKVGTKINGTVKVEGFISDNYRIAAAELKLSSLEDYVTSTWKQTVDITGQSKFSVTVPTTAISSTTGSLYYQVIATDTAGNTKTEAGFFEIDQSSDAPQIVLTNALANGYNVLSDIAAKSNVFGKTSNNKIFGSASDDDGIAKIEYSTNGGSSWSTLYNPSTGPYSTTKAFDFTLPPTVGVYGIQVRVTDSKDETAYKQTVLPVCYVAVDDGAPTITLANIQNEYKKAGENITVGGTMSDGSLLHATAAERLTVVGSETSTTLTPSDQTGGTWSETFVASAAGGSHSRTYTAKDVFGNTSSVTYTYNVDLTPPTINTPTWTGSFVHKDETPYFYASAVVSDTGGSLLKGVYYTVLSGHKTYAANSGELATATWTLMLQGTGGLWSAAIPFDLAYPEGDYTLFIKAEDNAGNASIYNGQKQFYVDNAKPTVSIPLPQAEITGALIGKAAFNLTGTAADSNLQTVTARIDSIDLSVTGTNDWQVAVPVSTTTATYTVIVTAKDTRERTGSASYTFSRDTTRPTLNITNPVEGEQVTTNTYTLKGTANDTGGGGFAATGSVSYSVNSTNGLDGVWTDLDVVSNSWATPAAISLGADEGTLNVWFKARDRFNNESTPIKRSFFYDKTAPTISETIINTTNIVYKGAAFALGGRWTESNKLSKIKIEYTKDGSPQTSVEVVPASPDDKGTDVLWSYPFSSMGNGEYEFTITATDAANRDSSRIVRRINVDLIEPTAPTDISATGVFTTADAKNYYSGIVTLSGTAADTGTGASGIKEVAYSFDIGAVKTWTLLTGAENWTGSIDCSSTGSLATNGKIKQGANTLYLRSVDKADLICTTPTEYTLYLDWAVPVATSSETEVLIKTKVDKSFTGLAHDNGIITSPLRQAKTAVLSYTKDGGAIQSIAADTGANQFNWSGSTGAWAYTLPTSLGDGLYVLTLTVTDEAGKTASVARNIQIDTTAPDLDITQPAEAAKQSVPAYTIKGTARDTGVGLAALNTVQVSFDGGTNWINAAISGTNWTYTDSFSDRGKITYSVRTSDKVGNEKVVGPRTFYYDSGAPVLTETAVNTVDIQYLNGDEGSTSVVFAGKVTEDWKLADTNGFTVSINGTMAGSVVLGTGTLSAGQNWTYTFEKSLSGTDREDGLYTLVFTATDGAEQTASITRKVMIDKTAPSIVSKNITTSGTTVGGETWYKVNSLNISGTASDATSGLEKAEYKVGSGLWNALSGTTGWGGIVAGLSNGSVITVRLTDKAGNATVHDFDALKIDLLPPTVNVTSHSGTKLVNGTQDVTVTGICGDSESGVATVKLKLGNQDFSAGTIIDAAVSGTTWTATVPSSALTASGTMYVQAADNVGNTTVIPSFYVQLDSAKPTVSITLPANSATVNKTITIAGTAGDDQQLDTVKLYRKSGSLSTNWSEITGLTGTYNWNISLDTSADGFDSYDSDGSTAGIQVTLRAVATDKAGNEQASDLVTITVDQDADRPVIRVNNLNLSGMSSGNSIWLKYAKIIYGTVTDDDGAVLTLEISINGGTNWNLVTVDNGSWTYTVANDGTNTLMFKVEDKAGTVFTSVALGSNLSLNVTPKITDGMYRFGYADAACTDKGSSINLTVDTVAPTLTDVQYSLTGADGPWLTSYNTEKFGGKNSSFFIRCKAADTNGLSVSAPVTATLAGTSVTAAAGTGTNAGWFVLSDIDVSSTKFPAGSDGSKSVILKSTDKAGLETTVVMQINVDNTPPVISVINPPATISGPEAIRGSVDSTSTVYYKVQKATDVSDPTATDPNWNQIKDAGMSWLTSFDGTVSIPTSSVGGGTHDVLFKKYLSLLGITTEAAINARTYTEITYLKVWIKAVDESGNSTIKSQQVSIDPQGDRPVVQLGFPQNNGITLGGNIRLMGGATDNINVESVWIQIDTSKAPQLATAAVPFTVNENDGDSINGFTFNQNDPIFDTGTASDRGYSVTLIDSVSGVATPPVAPISYGIKVAVQGGSWNLTINKLSEFDPPTPALGDPAQVRFIAIRIYARDNEANWSKPIDRYIVIDKDTPVIDLASLKVVQYASGTSGATIAEREYVDGMSLKGKWYLRGDITDASGLKSVTQKAGSILTSLALPTDSSVEGVLVRKGSAIGSYFNYTLNIPVGSNSGVMAETFELTATEGTDKNLAVTKTFSFMCDNTAPEIAAQGTSEFKISTDVLQSDGFYTFGSLVKEDSVAGVNQSGLERVVFYLVRTLEGKKYIYNPMLNNKRVQITGAGTASNIVEQDGLYWQKLTVGRNPANLPILTGVDPNEHIRVGGVVKVGGVVYRISAISGWTVTLAGSPPADKTEVLFGLSQVVDNFSAEAANGLNPPLYDDGDGMLEEIRTQGTTYRWQASINSLNIPDGNIEITYVVFDKAGNSKQDTVTAAFVKNNQPRIAGIKLGTDDNASGTVEPAEIISTYSNLYTRGLATDGTKKVKADFPAAGGSALKIKGKTIIQPEIVGGNGNLKYTYKVTKNGAPSAYYTKEPLTTLGTGAAEPANATDPIPKLTNDIVFELIDFLSPGSTDPTGAGKEISDGDLQKFTFYIWDSTEGQTAGTDSQKAELNITMDVALRDAVPPTMSMKPFYWTSESVNSLYEGKRANGHIELEGDLPLAFTSGGSGTMDRDPKVSGKVTIEGTANDNKVLQHLYISIPNMNAAAFTGLVTTTAGIPEVTYYRVASYSGGSWTAVDRWTDQGWRMEIDNAKQSFSQENGHTVPWKFHWDSSRITNVAANDVIIRVVARDPGAPSLSGASVVYNTPNTSTPGTAQTSAGTNTAYYKVDVVPYITSIGTLISGSAGAEFARAAGGHYPVYAGEVIRLFGFNLNSPTVTLGTQSLTVGAVGTEDGKPYYPITVGTAAAVKTGLLTVTVNSISTLNNTNCNPEFDAGNAITKAGYNSQANTANIFLTDNIGLYVWTLETFVNNADLTSPMLKIDAASNWYMSYGRGVPSMVVNRNGTETQVDYSYNKFHNTAVAFDTSQNIYAVGTNTDRISNSSAKYSLYSRAVASGFSPGSYQSSWTGKTRLETVHNNNTGIYNINRVKRPKLAVGGTTTSTQVYMAYFDGNHPQNPVKFRYGTINSSNTCSGGIAGDAADPAIDGGSAPGFHTVADSSTTYKGGEYTAVGFTSTGVAVVAWYDASQKRLVYSYNAAPGTPVSGGVWQTNAKVIDPSYAGWYVDLAVDADNGIHIAYYNTGKGDLKYAYLSSYDADPVVVTVDSYLSTGTQISINTRKEGSNNVPYISYYYAAFSQTSTAIRTAWRTDFTSLKNGAVNDSFTGAWEVMTVPVQNVPNDAPVCNGVPTSGTWANTIALGFMTDKAYERAVLRK